MDLPLFPENSDTEMSDDENMPPLVDSSDEEEGFNDWDLEMELLSKPGLGGSQSDMRGMARKIAKACYDVPSHVKELATISAAHVERDLQAWLKK